MCGQYKMDFPILFHYKATWSLHICGNFNIHIWAWFDYFIAQEGRSDNILLRVNLFNTLFEPRRRECILWKSLLVTENYNNFKDHLLLSSVETVFEASSTE